MHLKTVGTRQSRNEARRLHVKAIENDKEVRKSNAVHNSGAHSALSTTNMVITLTEYGFRANEWHFPSVAYADDIVVQAISQKALRNT